MNFDYSDKKQFLEKIRAAARKNEVSPQIMLQEVMLDELLERISKSNYRDNLVLKGGFLIASLLGVNTRSTRDIDTSVVGMPVTEQQILEVFKNICTVKLPDDIVELKVNSVKEIREDAEYSGFRMHIIAQIFSTIVNLKVDISTGDVITEHAIEYKHKLLLEDRSITIKSYNLETIIAEKLQTAVNRSELNTRLKDYYDLYLFQQKKENQIDFKLLKKALLATIKNRKDNDSINDYVSHINELIKSDIMIERWKQYQTKNLYADGILFKDTCSSAIILVKKCILAN